MVEMLHGVHTFGDRHHLNGHGEMMQFVDKSNCGCEKR